MPGLASPHPLGGTLPGLYADDSFAQRLCEALDEVLAPVVARLDCLWAYLDAATAPADLLEWLAGWVGMTLAPDVPDERRRQIVASAAQLYVWRGTPSAIRAIVQLTTGHTPEIEESGGTSWSQEPGGQLPDRIDPGLVVRLRAANPRIDEQRITALIAPFIPAHVPWRVELIRG